MPILYRQVRIFALGTEPNPNWVENVVGRVIKPAIAAHATLWFWFSRYIQLRTESGEDTDLAAIPDACNFLQGERIFLRSIRFRIAVDEAESPAFEERVMELIVANRYSASSFLDYDWIGDMAADRFLAPPRTQQRRQQRATLVAPFLNAAAHIYLDALKEADDHAQFHLETNEGYPFGLGSSLEPLRHLFVNLTGAPTQIAIKAGQIESHPLGEPQVVLDLDAQSIVKMLNWNLPPNYPTNPPPPDS